MPFLLPALTALVSDSVILYLTHVEMNSSDLPIGGTHKWIYRVGYTIPLAIIRLVLLLFPLPYHSYTGTAIQCQAVYRLFYGGSIAWFSFQMLAIIMYDPESISSIVINHRNHTEEDAFLSSNNNNNTVPDGGGGLVRHVLRRYLLLDKSQSLSSLDHEMRLIWFILILSFLSNWLHLVLLWHVKSSAPQDWKYRKHVLYYYARQRQQQLENGQDDPQQQQQQQRQQQQRQRNGEPDGLFLLDEENQLPPQQQQQPRGSLHAAIHPQLRKLVRLPEGYDAFMAQLQSRLETTKKQWTKRLEEFTRRIGENVDPDGSAGNLQLSNPSASAIRFPRPTPFSVLLRLFAYDNSALDQLDQAFEDDDAAIFYVPQLLSFLLYNAFDTAPPLEEWILNHCRTNVYFAHRCFWFLRSWCLEVGALKEESTTPSRAASHNSLASMMEEMQQTSRAGLSKFPPEERTVMEGLLFRVVECGELPARILQYGTKQDREGIFRDEGEDSSDDDGEDNHLSVAKIPMASSAGTMSASTNATLHLPVDPNSGYPSAGHWNVVTAKSTFGFVPLPIQSMADDVFMNTPRFLDALMQLADALFTVPREQRTSHLRKQLSIMETEWLPSNSVYLPVNQLYHRVWRIVADESIAISTKERVPCIIYLEVMDLGKNPSSAAATNSGTLHDSIDLRNSTSSIDPMSLTPPSSPGGAGAALGALLATPGGSGPNNNNTSSSSSSKNERDIVQRWRTARRYPLRYETFIHKVANFTDKNLRMIRASSESVPDALVWDSEDGPSLPKRKISGDGILTPMLLDGDNPSSNDDTANTGGSHRKQVSMGQWGSSSMTSSQMGRRRRIFSDRYREPRDQHDDLYYDVKDDEARIMDSLIANNMEDRHFSQNQHPTTNHHHDLSYGSNQKQSTPSSTTRTPDVVFKESWEAKHERLRSKSVFGSDPRWRLMPILIKSNDDLRQEQLASQLIYRMATILAKEKIPVWLCPYEIVALTDRGGIIEAIPDTISIDSLKRNDPNFTSLAQFFADHFGEGTDEYMDAKANFIESLAGYSMVCFLLQIKDRHNGNILLDNRGHLIHIDFGFFFLSSPGKNTGFESAPFKLTRDFCDIMGGPKSHAFRAFRELCARTFLCLRKHCYEITLLVEMLMVGNEDLNCFRGRPQDAVRELRERFRLDLNDRACHEYVNALVDESIENWRTRWYDRYQRFCVGVL